MTICLQPALSNNEHFHYMTTYYHELVDILDHVWSFSSLLLNHLCVSMRTYDERLQQRDTCQRGLVQFRAQDV